MTRLSQTLAARPPAARRTNPHRNPPTLDDLASEEGLLGELASGEMASNGVAMDGVFSTPSAAPRIVLVLGSAADAVRARAWPRTPFAAVVAINNAWQIRSDWDYLIHPEDFPRERWPTSLDPQTQSIVTAADYVPVQNRFGGFVYAGGTMAFTAAYWALGALQPDVIAFVGCDMVYGTGPQTHFYGKGAADPLREDVTLQSLEAKSLRLLALAAQENCVLVNLSEQASSRLVYPRSSAAALAQWSRSDWREQLQEQGASLNPLALRAALHRESELGYMVQSGRYWEVRSTLDAAKLNALDQQWLAVGQVQSA
jgi:hypothetical protein